MRLKTDRWNCLRRGHRLVWKQRNWTTWVRSSTTDLWTTSPRRPSRLNPQKCKTWKPTRQSPTKGWAPSYLMDQMLAANIKWLSWVRLHLRSIRPFSSKTSSPALRNSKSLNLIAVHSKIYPLPVLRTDLFSKMSSTIIRSSRCKICR